MPTGNGASPELMPTPEQRKYMIKRIREIRANEGGKPIFAMDFQNDGEFVGGCIAGGRNYFHINSNGDAEPCVFIHYSNVNIKDHTLLEVLKSPLFMAYHREQPFNRYCRALPHAGKSADAAQNGGRKRRPLHRHGVPRKRGSFVRQVRRLRRRMGRLVAKEIWAEQKHKKP